MRDLPQDLGGDVILDGRLDLPTAYRIAAGHCRPDLAPEVRDRCAAAEGRLHQAIVERRHIYGLTTGFGPLANRLVDPEDGVTLQQNLVHHLASGVGPVFAWHHARAIVLARLSSILQGVSGASAQSIGLLLAVLRSDLAPAIPCRGTVGASGDLTPLAHMVLCLQGRAAFLRQDGSRIPGTEALAELGQPPLDLARRDGLALVNGTSAMTGLALCNAIETQRVIGWSVALTAGLAECLGGRTEAWHPAFSAVRPHPGQQAVAAALMRHVAGSARLQDTPLALRRLGIDEIRKEDSIGQDAYTLRCAPQVIGAVQDTLDWHDTITRTELNAATDNPIFPAEGAVPALHGGNFMGQHVALASDALGQAVCVLAGLVERQIARVTDERLNGGLPAFLTRGPEGLNSGLMGAQVTATALLAELRSIGAASIHSLSTNGANQDVVSMGTIAARLTATRLDRTQEILAILALAVAQAIDILEQRAGGPGSAGFSPHARAVHRCIRAHSAPLTQDRPLGEEIAQIAHVIGQVSWDPERAF
jgi:tyrosine ammonia-lyase